MSTRTRSKSTYEKHGIDPKYDSTDAYDVSNSHYGNGRYPPDWANRRDAVWERQKYQCGRCGTYKGDSAVNEVHHIVHLANGGSNRLDNLVGLCGDCHALMHPDVNEIRGALERAPVFPHPYAEDSVAVVRHPRDDDELATDLTRLGEFSSPDENGHAVTTESVPTSSAVAKRTESDLYDLLVERGFVPRTSAYHRIRIVPSFSGLRGVFTSFVPDVSVTSDGTCTEREWIDGNDHCDAFYTPDASNTTIELRDELGETATERIWFTDHDDGSRFRLERTVSPPPVTLRTTPRYAVDAAKYFGWRSFTWGVLPAFLLAFLAPSIVPFGGSIIGFLTLVLFVGLIIRAPWIARDVYAAVNPTAERIYNERVEDN